jgi:hypothetical protein
MCMKTQGHMTQCRSQFCDFERGFATGLQSLSALSRFIVPGYAHLCAFRTFI